jgi:hypothetical protein
MYRADGRGPAFVKCGLRVLYSETSLDSWAKARITPEVSSLAELRERAA